MHARNDQPWSLSSDRPIANRAEDKLGRARFAEALARQIVAAPSDGGFVIGLVGPWGSGKSSILNMVAESLDETSKTTVLRFNPWFFSGTEDLIVSFFSELSAELFKKGDPRLNRLASLLETYGSLLSPIAFVPYAGPWIAGIASLAKVGGQLLKRKPVHRPSVTEQRSKIIAALDVVDARFVVMIDDLDRLPPNEIRELVKLVRLVADFPKVTYLAAFDRARVEESLADGVEGRGRDYLEKVVQVIHDVPIAREGELSGRLFEEIDKAIQGLPAGPFDVSYWQNVSSLVIKPLFRSVRDIRRYANALPVTLATIGEEVNLVDALALEAVRSMAPGAYARLPASVGTLTTIGNPAIVGQLAEASRAKGREDIAALLREAGERHGAIREMCRHLFPASQQYLSDNVHYTAQAMSTWRRERRVAHGDVLQFFLEKSLPAGTLPAAQIQRLFELLGDSDQLQRLLGELSAATLEHALKRLEDFQGVFEPDTVGVAVPILMNQLPRLREGREGFGDDGAAMQLTRVVLRLLRRIPDEGQRDEIVRHAIVRIDTLSAQLEFVDLVGHREHVGHGLVSPDLAQQLEAELRQRILSSGSEALAAERDLLPILFWVTRSDRAQSIAWVRERAENDKALLRLLRSALSEAFTASLGQVSAKRSYRLPWDILTELLGDDLLRRRLEAATATADVASLDPRTAEALRLANQYLSGWRPADGPRR